MRRYKYSVYLGAVARFCSVLFVSSYQKRADSFFIRISLPWHIFYLIPFLARYRMRQLIFLCCFDLFSVSNWFHPLTLRFPAIKWHKSLIVLMHYCFISFFCCSVLFCFLYSRFCFILWIRSWTDSNRILSIQLQICCCSQPEPRLFNAAFVAT